MLAQIVAHWIGGSGNWSDPSHGDIGIVPNNGGDTAYAVFIDIAASDVTVTVNQVATVSALTTTEVLRFVGGNSAITTEFTNNAPIEVTGGTLSVSGRVPGIL